MEDNIARAREEIRDRILSQVDLTRETDDEELSDLIRNEVIAFGHDRSLSLMDRLSLEREIFNSLRKLDILQELLDDDEITEIMINSPRDIFIEKRGEIKRLEKSFSSEEKLSDVIQQIFSSLGQFIRRTII